LPEHYNDYIPTSDCIILKNKKQYYILFSKDKGVDKDDSGFMYDKKDTWSDSGSGLTNPYVPSAADVFKIKE
jgi:hypothetical protein